MSDTPIYDLVRTGGHRVKRAATLDAHVLTLPVTDGVQAAIERWNERNGVSLAIALAPYGIHPYDLTQPEYRRVIYPDEILENGTLPNE